MNTGTVLVVPLPVTVWAAAFIANAVINDPNTAAFLHIITFSVRLSRSITFCYCNVTTTSISPLPESRLPNALPITAPVKRLRSVPFMA